MNGTRFERHGAPDVIELFKVEKPIPTGGRAQIRVASVVANLADCRWRNGRTLRYCALSLRHAPGCDVAGEVTETGNVLCNFAAADRVVATANESYVEFTVADVSAYAFVQSGFEYIQATALPSPSLTDVEMVGVGVAPSTGPTVLVTGTTGNLGRFAATATGALGARVIAADRVSNMDKVRELRSDEVIDITGPSLTICASTMSPTRSAGGMSPTSVATLDRTTRSPLSQRRRSIPQAFEQHRRFPATIWVASASPASCRTSHRVRSPCLWQRHLPWLRLGMHSSSSRVIATAAGSFCCHKHPARLDDLSSPLTMSIRIAVSYAPNG